MGPCTAFLTQLCNSLIHVFSNRRWIHSLGNQKWTGKMFLSAKKSCVTSADRRTTRGRPIFYRSSERANERERLHWRAGWVTLASINEEFDDDENPTRGCLVSRASTKGERGRGRAFSQEISEEGAAISEQGMSLSARSAVAL